MPEATKCVTPMVELLTFAHSVLNYYKGIKRVTNFIRTSHVASAAFSPRPFPYLSGILAKREMLAINHPDDKKQTLIAKSVYSSHVCFSNTRLFWTHGCFSRCGRNNYALPNHRRRAYTDSEEGRQNSTMTEPVR